ncbi:TRAP transporter small permease [Poseidonocella sp. HB161398]|uniref:TRAP transporter small permease n=1 Tax=Poseidonocella sp. HB161398 TaxID=2320855 RepID=UPI0011086157|nr:TRAP transporter small permease subunit [Poseidonocella sp. HB161398]
METLKSLLSGADRLVARLSRWGVVLCLAVLFLLLLARVAARTTGIPFAAYDEIVELATVWLTISGAIALWREGALYRVDVITAAFPGFGRPAELLVQLLMLAFAFMLLKVGLAFTLMSREVTAFMQIDMAFYYGAIPFAGAVMAVYSLAGLTRALRELRDSLAGRDEHSGLSKRALPEHL